MTDTTTIDVLCQRMIEDMTARKLGPASQKSRLRAYKRFAAWLQRSPDTATADDIRLFQLHLAETGVGTVTRNATMTGLRFLFRVTLRRHDLAFEIYHIKEPQKVPLILDQDEAKRMLAMAHTLRNRLLLSLGYGTGLRAGEIVRLKVKHIDSAQMIIHVEQSKGRKDRLAMLSPDTLALLREWWKVRPSFYDGGVPVQERLFFPGRKPGQPLTTRQLNRLFHQTTHAAGIRKAVNLHSLRHSFATHLYDRGGPNRCTARRRQSLLDLYVLCNAPQLLPHSVVRMHIKHIRKAAHRRRFHRPITRGDFVWPAREHQGALRLRCYGSG
jgi:integrase/recombinase XerD